MQHSSDGRNGALARELERRSGKRLADYPYDRDARVEALHGLEKLRAVDSPFREQLWALYWIAEAREANGDAERQRREERMKSEESERQSLLALADACIAGRRGREAQEAAKVFLFDGSGRRREDLASLRVLSEEVSRSRRRHA